MYKFICFILLFISGNCLQAALSSDDIIIGANPTGIDFIDNLNDDSIFIMIADQGLVDVEFIYLKDHEISKYLNLLPSIESRTTAFSVNNKEEFERMFNKHFKKHFKLYKSEDFLNSKYLYHKVSKEKLRPFLLDYVAVAKGKYAFSYEENKQFTMKANHAGSCKDEFIIPIVINKKNINK